MEKITTTKQELAEAFDKWNKEFINDPSKFETNDVNAWIPEKQAETLIDYLNE